MKAKVEKEKPWKKSTASLSSPSSAKNFDIQLANWRMESIVRESESGSEDEFFDCQGTRNRFHRINLKSMVHIDKINS